MRRAACAAVLLLLAAAGCGGAGAPPAPRLLVGAVEDAPKWGDAQHEVALARRAGLRALVFSAVWAPPETRPSPPELAALRGAVSAAVAGGVRPIVAVYSFGPVTPDTPAGRAQFVRFAASIPRLLPAVRTVSVGNEPNNRVFWRASPAAYEALLADAHDALKAVSPRITVIGGSVAARGAVPFIRALGAAYRASGRTRPLLDAFSLHPYGESSAVPPTRVHPSGDRLGIADYPRLVRLLRAAFGRVPPIVYGEYGVQSRIPPREQRNYAAYEQLSSQAVPEATQARFLREAIELAACQPRVTMLLLFHVFDEWNLLRLQTGLYHADGTPKPSARSVADAPLTCSP